MTVQELDRTDTSYSLGPAYPQLLSSLSGWFRSRGVPSEEAKDLGQETVVRTLVHLKRHGQRGEDLKPLVFTIARNLLTERARRGYGNVVTLTEDIDVADTAPTPLDTVMQTEERTAVSEALSSLGSRHRKVIELWMKGDTPADIAHTLGIKRNAADALLHRARRRLASVLRESGQAFGAFLGLWGIRLRRAANALGQADPGALLAQAAGAVAAVSIAGAMTVGGPGAVASVASHPLQHVATTPTVQHVTSRQAAVPPHPTVASQNASTVPANGVIANVAGHNQHAAAVANVPGNGTTSGQWGVGVWHQPGSSQSPSEVVVNTGTAAVCQVNCPAIGGAR